MTTFLDKRVTWNNRLKFVGEFTVLCFQRGGEISKRGICAEYEIHWNTLKKILTHTKPPGYRLTKTRVLKIDPFLPTVIVYLESDISPIESSGIQPGRYSSGFRMSMDSPMFYETES